MASTTIFVICALVQVALGQYLPRNGMNVVSGNSAIENTVIIDNDVSNRGGYGLVDGLGWNNGIGFGNGIGIGNGIGFGNGIGIGNGVGLAGAGLAGAGWLNNAGLNSGLIGNAGLYGNGAFGNTGFINLAPVAAGGVLPISSYGPVVPAGLNVVSDNAIEGAVLVSGELPFLSAVAFEGALASAGSGAAACGCGTGNIGMVSETKGPVAGIGNGFDFGAGFNGLAGRRLGRFY